jgi:hypothetical protein
MFAPVARSERRSAWGEGRRGALRTLAVAAPMLGVLAGCGGGARQDASEPSATFSVQVVRAAFPTSQTLAEHSALDIRVMNTGSKTVPDIAVTVDGFTYRVNDPSLASQSRPAWIVDSGPAGGDSSYTNTWALGALPPGHTADFLWHLTAIHAGSHTLHWTVAAGLNGKAGAQQADGVQPHGQFAVDVTATPQQVYVDPATGKVVTGSLPLAAP